MSRELSVLGALLFVDDIIYLSASHCLFSGYLSKLEEVLAFSLAALEELLWPFDVCFQELLSHPLKTLF